MKKIFLLFAALAVAGACGRGDDTGSPAASNADRDWFVIEDSEDPLDHARYEIYRDYGISVYYDDVIGTEMRGTDGYGDPIVHTERLDPFYNVTYVQPNTEYDLPVDRGAMLFAVELLRERIIPGMIPGNYPRTILLADRLIYTDPITNIVREDDVYKGYKTTIVSKVGSLGGMTPQEREAYSTRILAALWYDYAINNYAEDLEAFFAVSESTWEANNIAGDINAGIYEETMSYPNLMPGATQVGTARFYRDNWMCFGFLAPSANTVPTQPYPITPGLYSTWRMPSQPEDAVSFIAAAMTHNTADDFDAWWQALPENTPYEPAPAFPYTGNRWGDLLTRKYDLTKALISKIKTDTEQ